MARIKGERMEEADLRQWEVGLVLLVQRCGGNHYFSKGGGRGLCFYRLRLWVTAQVAHKGNIGEQKFQRLHGRLHSAATMTAQGQQTI